MSVGVVLCDLKKKTTHHGPRQCHRANKRENRMRCLVCCNIAYPVLLWKAPPASKPPAPPRSPSTTDLFGGSPTATAAVGVGGGATEEATAAATTAMAVVRRYTKDAIAVE